MDRIIKLRLVEILDGKEIEMCGDSINIQVVMLGKRIPHLFWIEYSGA